MPSTPFKVSAPNFIGEPTTFSIGVENSALIVTYEFDGLKDGKAALVTVKFIKGSIEVQVTSDNPKENLGAFYKQCANGCYDYQETGNMTYYPEMESFGKALFQEIYPEIISAAMNALTMLTPAEKATLTKTQQALMNGSSRLLQNMRPAQAER